MSTVLPQKHSHSLLCIGASREEAKQFCMQILGPSHRTKIESGNHPDLHFYTPEGKSDLHPMGNIQKLIAEMSLPPFEAPYKIFIIEEAEKMLPSSSNALLKTLEEPEENTYLLLLTDYPDLMLPTLLSRLQPISFSRKEMTSIDLSSYFNLIQQRKWDDFFQHLLQLEEEDPQAVLHGFLLAGKSRKNGKTLSDAILEAQKALDHNLKPRTVYLNLFLQFL